MLISKTIIKHPYNSEFPVLTGQKVGKVGKPVSNLVQKASRLHITLESGFSLILKLSLGFTQEYKHVGITLA